MKRKIVAALCASVVLSMGTMTVMAADSPNTPTDNNKITIGNTTVEVSEGFELAEVTNTKATDASVTAAFKTESFLNTVVSTVKNDTLTAANTDSTKTITPSVLTVVDVTADGAVKGSNGKYQVRLSLSDVKAGDIISVLHFTGTTWEVLTVTGQGAGYVDFETADLSPVAVVKMEITSNHTITVGNKKVTVEDTFAVGEVSEATQDSVVSALTTTSVWNAVVTSLNNSLLNTAVADTTSKYKIDTEVLAVVNVEADGATKVNDKYSVKLMLDGIKKGDLVSILHFTGNTWEVLNVTGQGAGYVEFETANLSPVAVVKVSVTEKTTSTTTSSSTSPATGATASVAAIASLVSLASAAYAKKRYNEE
jgi:hypothetical protein